MSEKIKLHDNSTLQIEARHYAFSGRGDADCANLAAHHAYRLGLSEGRAEERERWEKAIRTARVEPEANPTPAWVPPTKAETADFHRNKWGSSHHFASAWCNRFDAPEPIRSEMVGAPDALALQLALERSR